MAIALRRSASRRSDSSASSIAQSLPSVNFGDLIIVSVTIADPANTITASIADAAANSWTALGGKVRNATEQDACFSFYAWGVAASGADNITVTFSASGNFRTIAITEWRDTNGPWTSSPLDKTASATGTGTSITSGSVTPASAGQLIYAAVDAGVDEIAAVAPFTLHVPAGGHQFYGAVGYIQPTAAAITGKAKTTTSSPWAIQVGTFAGVAGTVIPPVVAPSAAASTAVRTNAPSSGRARTLMAGGR